MWVTIWAALLFHLLLVDVQEALVGDQVGLTYATCRFSQMLRIHLMCTNSFPGMVVPGIIGVVAGLLVLLIVTDSPTAKGLPTPEEIAEEQVVDVEEQSSIVEGKIGKATEEAQSEQAEGSGALTALKEVMGRYGRSMTSTVRNSLSGGGSLGMCRWEMWLLGLSY